MTDLSFHLHSYLLFFYIYIYIHIHIYIYIYIYIYTYTCIHYSSLSQTTAIPFFYFVLPSPQFFWSQTSPLASPPPFMPGCICMCVCVFVWLYVCLCVCVLYMCLCVCVFMCVLSFPLHNSLYIASHFPYYYSSLAFLAQLLFDTSFLSFFDYSLTFSLSLLYPPSQSCSCCVRLCLMLPPFSS